VLGSLYERVVKDFKIDSRIGDGYMKGKNDFLTKVPDYGCRYREGHENLLYGDPTLKIKAMPSDFIPN
jgi:hypothetical protein